MPRYNLPLEECTEELDLLLTAVRRVQEWRERCLLSIGLKPPTSYYRVLLWLYVQHEASSGKPVAVPVIGRNVGISAKAMTHILRQMAYDGLVEMHTSAQALKYKEVTITPQGIEMAQS